MAYYFSSPSSSPCVSHDSVQQPCFTPTPTHTARFVDGDDAIGKVEKHFQDSDSTPVHSLALYGMGGGSTSQLAVKYLEDKQMNFDAIFWVDAENTVSMQQSFTNIALRLNLPDTDPATHDQNRIILKGWLQNTGTLEKTTQL